MHLSNALNRTHPKPEANQFSLCFTFASTFDLSTLVFHLERNPSPWRKRPVGYEGSSERPHLMLRSQRGVKSSRESETASRKRPSDSPYGTRREGGGFYLFRWQVNRVLVSFRANWTRSLDRTRLNQVRKAFYKDFQIARESALSPTGVLISKSLNRDYFNTYKFHVGVEASLLRF